MFAQEGKYRACGIFTIGHLLLFLVTIIVIGIALKYTSKKSKSQVHKIIKYTTIVIYILEVVKIIFNIKQNSLSAVNTYLPLYYCSILLYAGLLSSFAKNKLKRVGDVSLATGSIVGGLVFIAYPSTSLPIYPAFHFLSIHSFLFHGTMIYLGILINKTRYIELRKEDAIYFASLVFGMSMVALATNNLFNGNLMFISHNLPGTLIEILYKITNGGILFTTVMIIGQMTLPFYISYYIIKKMQNIKNKEKVNENR